MKKFTKGYLITALVLFILGCLICAICGVLGGFRQIHSGALNGIAGIPFGYYRQADGGYSFGFWSDDRKVDDTFWEKGNWQKADANGTKQKLAVTADTLCNLGVVVTDCNFTIEESSDEYAWLSVEGDTNKTYYRIETTMGGKHVLSIENAGYHRVGNGRKGPNDTISLYLPKGYDLSYISIDMGAGYMESVPLQADAIEIQVGAGVCEVQGLEATSVDMLAGAGQIETDELKANTAVLEIGLGEIVVRQMDVRDLLEVEVGLGNAEITGKAAERLEAECNLGNLNMYLSGSEDDYGFEVDCDMGDVRIGSHHCSNLSGSKTWNEGRKKQMEIDCEMGNVTITFEDGKH